MTQTTERGHILDGKAVASRWRTSLKKEVRMMAECRHERPPGLAVILVGENPASQVYVRSKVKNCQEVGIRSFEVRLPSETDQKELLEHIHKLNEDPAVDGILVQLPIPDHLDENAILNAIDPAKDVDGFHPINVGKLCLDQSVLEPCTPAGILRLLKDAGIQISGRKAVVVGRSHIVGKPMALLLLRHHATVTICHSRTPDLPTVCKQADILVGAVGRPAMLGYDHIQSGAVVIDVGINRVEDPEKIKEWFGPESPRLQSMAKWGYTLVGDVHPQAMKELASHYTPVPGGVGPLTIAQLLQNTLRARRSRP